MLEKSLTDFKDLPKNVKSSRLPIALKHHLVHDLNWLIWGAFNLILRKKMAKSSTHFRTIKQAILQTFVITFLLL